MSDEHYAVFDSPVGLIWITANDLGVTSLFMRDSAPTSDELGGRTQAQDRLAYVIEQLDEYFAQQRQHFDVALQPSGTPFQQSVWAQLLAIPYGTTTSYGEIARRINNPKAVRAVGLANGANPISILIPCHRVIGAKGSLVGFGAGLARKRALLTLEASQEPQQPPLPFNNSPHAQL